MTSNGDRFEGAYNKIDALLRKKVGEAQTHSFSSVVNEAARKDPTVHLYKDDLLEYGDLKNAIVHDRGKSAVLLADPREDVVIKIEKILNSLSHPRLLRVIAHSVPLRIFTASAVLAEALSYMRENDFSQVIVLCDGKYLILSAEGIAHWLESKLKKDIIALSNALLSNAPSFEPKDSNIYLKATDTVDRAREVFANDMVREYSARS